MINSIIAESKVSDKLKQQVTKAFADLKPVIFQASTGTGKSFFAKLIHTNSSLKEGPFTEINCADLPRDEQGMVNNLNMIPISGKGTLLIDKEKCLSSGLT